MEFDRSLRTLPRPVLVEAVYLCGRYLTHGLTRETFLSQLKSDVKLSYRERSADVVLSVMEAIEEREGTSINRLPLPTRARYAMSLDDVLYGQVGAPASRAQVEDELVALRKVG